MAACTVSIAAVEPDTVLKAAPVPLMETDELALVTPLPEMTNCPVLSIAAPKPWLCSEVAILAMIAPLESVAEMLMNELT